MAKAKRHGKATPSRMRELGWTQIALWIKPEHLALIKEAAGKSSVAAFVRAWALHAANCELQSREMMRRSFRVVPRGKAKKGVDKRKSDELT